MGCGMSVEEKEGKQRNEEIENQLRKDRMSQRNEIKMLLLGRHHSGADRRTPATKAHLWCACVFRGR